MDTPPNNLIALISRVMKSDGYISNDLSTHEIDAIRQTQATLSIEQLSLDKDGISSIEKLVKGEVTREQFQKRLGEKFRINE